MKFPRFKNIKAVDLRNEINLKDYFVLTTLIGSGFFLSIIIFMLTLKTADRAQRHDIRNQASRFYSHVNLTLTNHLLGLKFIDNVTKSESHKGTVPLLETGSSFLNDPIFTSVGLLTVSHPRAKGNVATLSAHYDHFESQDPTITQSTFNLGPYLNYLPLEGNHKRFELFLAQVPQTKKWFLLSFWRQNKDGTTRLPRPP